MMKMMNSVASETLWLIWNCIAYISQPKDLIKVVFLLQWNVILLTHSGCPLKERDFSTG